MHDARGAGVSTRNGASTLPFVLAVFSAHMPLLFTWCSPLSAANPLTVLGVWRSTRSTATWSPK